MQINSDKTRVQSVKSPVKFLGFMHRLMETGKVVILADPQKVKHERKKIQRMVAKARKGEMLKRDIDKHFKAYKASVRHGNSHNLINRLNQWYESLWKEVNDAE